MGRATVFPSTAQENSKGRHQITVDGITYDEDLRNLPELEICVASQADSLERDFIDGKLSEQGLKESCIQRLPLARTGRSYPKLPKLRLTLANRISKTEKHSSTKIARAFTDFAREIAQDKFLRRELSELEKLHKGI